MDDDTTIIPLHQPGSVEDPLTEIARDGARRMLAAALRAEADAFVAQYAEETLPDGRQRVVRHGYGPERSIQTGIGALDVQRPKVRDRATDVPAKKKIRFTSRILPKWARRSRSLDALLPVLYLRGISTGDFPEALSAIPPRLFKLPCGDGWRSIWTACRCPPTPTHLAVGIVRACIRGGARGRFFNVVDLVNKLDAERPSSLPRYPQAGGA